MEGLGSLWDHIRLHLRKKTVSAFHNYPEKIVPGKVLFTPWKSFVTLPGKVLFTPWVLFVPLHGKVLLTPWKSFDLFFGRSKRSSGLQKLSNKER